MHWNQMQYRNEMRNETKDILWYSSDSVPHRWKVLSSQQPVDKCFTWSSFQRFLESVLWSLISIGFPVSLPFFEHDWPYHRHWMTSEQSLPLCITTLQHQLKAAPRNIESHALNAIALRKESAHSKPNDPPNWNFNIKDRSRVTTALRQILMPSGLSRGAFFSKLVFDPDAHKNLSSRRFNLPFEMVCSESACMKTRGWSLIFANAWLEHRRDS
jgi:hypothetical protein